MVTVPSPSWVQPNPKGLAMAVIRAGPCPSGTRFSPGRGRGTGRGRPGPSVRPLRRVGGEAAAEVGALRVPRVEFAVLRDELYRVLLGVVLRCVPERPGAGQAPPPHGSADAPAARGRG